ncbi:MAG TPA: flagellar export protein FliJ [Candidatus Baltobacteraceae bacterium]|jgi:flagellar export protein FliJ|nr:flagellar export protein FliJ [Candidatus Baltobacteraceae bacterium]
MKPFRFTLEAVRTLRQRHEQNAMELFAQALLARQQTLDRLEAIRRELTEGWQELRGQLAKGCTASQAAHAHDYHRTLAKRRDETIVALGVAERRVNAALQAMLAARQQREIVDKSCERQKARHLREQFRAEQKLLDDLAGRRSLSSISWNQTEALS